MYNITQGRGGKWAGRMGQPQQGSASKTDNKEILEHFQERKMCIIGGGWKKEKKTLKSRRDLKVNPPEEGCTVHTRGSRMENKAQELSVGQRIQDNQHWAWRRAQAWQSKGVQDAGCGPEKSASICPDCCILAPARTACLIARLDNDQLR